MTLEEYKATLALDLMRKISSEIGLSEIPPEDAFSLHNVELDFFVCWRAKRRNGGVFLSKQDGFCYIPFDDNVKLGDIDKWKDAYHRVINSLGLEAKLSTSPTWSSLIQEQI